METVQRTQCRKEGEPSEVSGLSPAARELVAHPWQTLFKHTSSAKPASPRSEGGWGALAPPPPAGREESSAHASPPPSSPAPPAPPPSSPHPPSPLPPPPTAAQTCFLPSSSFDSTTLPISWTWLSETWMVYCWKPEVDHSLKNARNPWRDNS